MGTTTTGGGADLNAQVLAGAAGRKSPASPPPSSVDYDRLSSAFRSTSDTRDRLAADRAEADALGAQVQMPRLSAPPPQQAPSDPLQAFGQPAMWIAAIGSLFTRHPFATAIQAAGAVMASTQKLDAEAAKQHFEQWKVQSENAMKLANYQMKAYEAAIKRIDVDSKAGKAELETHIAAFKDAVLSDAYQRGGLNEVKNLLFSRKKATEKAAAAQPLLEAHLKGGVSLAEGLNSDDPQQFANAFEQWNKHNVALAMQGKGAGGEKAQADLNYTSNELLAQRIRNGDEQALQQAKAIFGLKSQKPAGGKGLTPSQVLQDQVDDLMAKNPGMSKAEAENKAKQAMSTTLSPDAAHLIAEEYLAGNKQAAVGMSRSVGNMAAVQNEIAKLAAQKGMDGNAIAAQFADFMGSMSAERATATQGARVGMAASELRQLIPQAREMSKTVPRWGAMPVNKIIQALRGNASDPDLAAFAMQNQAVANAFAQVASRGGQSTDSARQHAYDLLSIARDDTAYQRQLDVLTSEADAILKGVHEQQAGITEHVRHGGAMEKPQAQSFASPDAVKAAVKAGTLSRDQAVQILTSQFGFSQ